MCIFSLSQQSQTTITTANSDYISVLEIWRNPNEKNQAILLSQGGFGG
jgi:hypothetical protein